VQASIPTGYDAGMKKITPLLAILSLSNAAQAHPGDHRGSDTQIFWHWMTQPDHLLLTLAGVAIALGLGLAAWSAARRQRR
jgi:hydrogenase/urease accessory protein HupE